MSVSRPVEERVCPPPAAVRSVVGVPLELRDGTTVSARLTTFDGLHDGREHLAISLGDPGPVPLVRLHSECLTGDVLGSARCDCGPQLQEALERIHAEGGILLYLRQEGRGIGLYAKLDAYLLQDAGLDTYDANRALGFGDDERDYTAAAQMLLALGHESVALLSNNPDKAGQLEELGVRVARRVRTGVHLTSTNERYLAAKASRAAHTLALPSLCVVSEGGLEPPRPIKGTSTSS